MGWSESGDAAAWEAVVGAGAGFLLLRAALDWAQAHRRTATIETTPFLTAARALYARFGFAPADPSTGDLHGTPLIRMRATLPTRTSGPDR